MKMRWFAVLLAAVLFTFTFRFFAFAATAPRTAIRPLPETGDAGQAAAALLQDYLEQITGERPAIIATGTAAQTVVLALQPDTAQPKGAYTLFAGGDEAGVFYIKAADVRGLWNGVYGFLRRVCGVEVYTPQVFGVPKNEAFTLPDEYDYRYEPLLEYADTDWASGRDAVFSVANGLNGSRSGIDALYGKPVNYIGFCHTLGSDYVPYWELFAEHPEYYALTARSGQREPTQVCLTNPDVLRLTIEGVKRRLDEAYDPDAALNIVSVSQLDNFDYCVCENCASLAETYGGPSGALIWFINQVAEAIEPAYPEAVIDTFAYEYTRHAPTGITTKDNVCVRLCSIECCFAHAIDDPACPENAAFYEDLQNWAKICHRLYVWDYTTDFNQSLGIFPNFGVLRENLRVFRENNVVGVFEQGVGSTVQCDTEFADLRAYLLACNMREDLTEQENEALCRGFLHTYYGEGADEIAAYLAFITAHAGDKDGHLFNRASMLKVMHGVKSADVKALDALWQTAIEKCEAAGNTAAAERVRRSQLSWRYYKACNGLREFRHGLALSRWTKANEELFNDIVSFGITSYDESKPMPETVNPLLYPLAWVDAEGMVLTIDMYLLPALAAAALALTVIALIKRKYILLLADIAALCGIFATTWLVDLGRYDLAATASCLLTCIFLTVAAPAILARAGTRARRKKSVLIGAIIACAVAGAFVAVLIVLDRNMMNGLRSHLAYFTVCLILEGAALLGLLGLLGLLPCALIGKSKRQ